MNIRSPSALPLCLAAIAVLAGACGPAFSAAPADELRDASGSTGDAGDAPAPAPDAAQDAPDDPGPTLDASDAADAPAPHCLTDLSGVGTRDFHIAFSLMTTASGSTYALLSQRASCDTSSGVSWDVTLQPLGGVELATEDGTAASYAFVEAGDSVNDGKSHRIVVARTNGALWYSDDGVIRSSMTPDAASFGTFGAALAIGSSACSSEAPLAGAVSDVCITVP